MGEGEPIHDYRITVRVRNNRILSRIEKAGFKTLRAFCRAYGLQYSNVVALGSMKLSAVLKNSKSVKGSKGGDWRDLVYDIAAALRCNPEDLFNERQAVAAFETTSVTVTSDGPMLQSLEDASNLPTMIAGPEDAIDVKEQVRKLLSYMTPRQERAVRLYYGIGGQGDGTLESVGIALGVVKERANQIIAKGMRRARERMAREERRATQTRKGMFKK